MKIVPRLILGGILLGAVAIGGSFFAVDQDSISEPSEPKTIESEGVTSLSTERMATVYKEPNCGCCNGYIAELKKQGFDVETVSTNDTASVKAKYGISSDKQSCHTTVIGDYFIEGHVPLVAIEKLLSEKPDIDGVGLPGMPLGTPGMPGEKQAPYEVYQKKGIEFFSFMII